MKTFSNYFLVFISFLIFNQNKLNSQICSDCICGTPNLQITGYDPDTIKSGRYKPERSDFNNTDPDAYFPILVVFVQFKNESGDSTITDINAWPARRPPNYLDSVIRFDRTSLSNWWDSYNGFAISDYCHVFSRGKYRIVIKTLLT
ncbi:MAG: hypothetical protein M3R36_16420 [Bacteroidota bacterium]|nr:hypothetical protein [Bacteroidota bacterium]